MIFTVYFIYREQFKNMHLIQIGEILRTSSLGRNSPVLMKINFRDGEGFSQIWSTFFFQNHTPTSDVSKIGKNRCIGKKEVGQK